MPTIGVVIPARDAGRYIEQTLESVLSQTLAPADVVVVDDGSTDDTAEIVARFAQHVRLERQPATGPAAARNRGIGSSSTDLVALLDADDVWPPDSLAARFESLANDPSIDLCFGRMIQFASPDLPVEEQRRLHVDPAPQPALASSAMLARRTAFTRVGPLPNRRAGDFLQWLITARAAGVRWTVIDDIVLRRRLHLHNLSRREPETHAHYLDIVRAELTRRRLAGEV